MYSFFIQLLILWSVLSTGFEQAAHVEVSHANLLIKNDFLIQHAYEANNPTPKRLDRINGITLLHSQQEMLRQLGPPITISQQPLLPDRFVYYYDHMNVGIAYGMIDYIEIVAEVGQFTVNEDTQLSVNLDALQQYYGEPHHVAQDGVVFEKNGLYVKAFYDRDNHSHIDSVHFFLES